MAAHYGTKGDYDKAITEYTAAIRIDPHYAMVYRGRARAYFQKGEFDKAVVDYTEALRLEPQSARAAEAYFGRGCSHSKKGDHDKAIADFTEAIRLNPEYAEAYQNRGCSYDKKGDHDKAITEYTAAAQIGDSYRQKESLPPCHNLGLALYAARAVSRWHRPLHRRPCPSPRRCRRVLWWRCEVALAAVLQGQGRDGLYLGPHDPC